MPPKPTTSPPSPTTTAKHKITSHPTLTAHRRTIYLTLLSVPPGRWTTYSALSKHLHSSPRAIGSAMRNNPFAPLVPCHRVLGAGGALGGFMGYSASSSTASKKAAASRGRREGDGHEVDGEQKLARKRALLESEGVRFLVQGNGNAKGRARVRAEGECFVEFEG